MNDIRIFQLKPAEPDLKTVLRMLDCNEESPVYEELVEMFEDMNRDIRMRIRPKAALAFAKVPAEYANDVLKEGDEVLYAVVTIGAEVSKLSARHFESGDYLAGMLTDAMADSCLFGLEKELLEKVQLLSMEHQTGIAHRFEAPVDIPMFMQKAAYEAVNAGQTLQMKITSGMMYDPVKSLCQVFEVTPDTSRFEVEHDCTHCERVDCPLRKRYEEDSQLRMADAQQRMANTEQKTASVTIHAGSDRHVLDCAVGTSLSDLLDWNNIYVSKPCGGNGKCGKCRIRLLKGSLEITQEDRRCFSKEELDSGLRLACLAVVTEDITAEVVQEEESGFHVLADQSAEATEINDTEFGFAIDIGTTTIAVTLLGLESRAAYKTYTTINHQRSYGADVIARMQSSNAGKKDELRKSIQQDLETGMAELADGYGIKADALKKVVIAGNTTMLHLLMGYSCETLGIFPFTPVNLKKETRSYAEVFESARFSAEVVLLPGISTFVGADITSGLYACGFDKKEKPCLIVDLGTNGEMAIGTRDKILVTSTAAGPAFEGGNIDWGIGSIPGAICQVRIDQGAASVETIGSQPPLGICGTGVICAVAELADQELIDETGRMDDDYFDHGFPLAVTPKQETIYLTQKDVREIQLAKSAIRAGIEVLIRRSGFTAEEIDTVYLAGGFGYHIDVDRAVRIGMIPESLQEKVIAAGNTSLQGARMALEEVDAAAVMEHLVDISEEISLSADRDFQDLYMEHMMFEE